MQRFKKRIPVHYTTDDGMQNSGLTMDVGPMGLFIVTRDRREADEILYLEVELPEFGTIEMTVRVARKKSVPGAVRAVQQSGFAVSVTNAPEEWYQFLKTIAEE